MGSISNLLVAKVLNFRQIVNNFPAVFMPLKVTYFLKWLPKKIPPFIDLRV